MTDIWLEQANAYINYVPEVDKPRPSLDGVLANSPEGTLLVIKHLMRNHLDSPAELIDYAAEADLAELAALAYELIIGDPMRYNSLASGFMHKIQQQSPSAAYPYVELLFGKSYASIYDHVFWRDPAHIPFLKSILTDPNRADFERRLALEYLFQSHDIPTMKEATAIARTLPALAGGAQGDNADAIEQLVRYCCMRAGLELLANDEFRRLTSDTVYHLAFEVPYLRTISYSGYKNTRYLNHPTWFRNEVDVIHAPFGGVTNTTCACCSRPLHRLLTLDPVPPGLVVTSRRRLELVTCNTCVIWTNEQLYFVYDEQGHATSYGDKRFIELEYQNKPYLPTSVRLVKTPERWRYQDYSHETRENICRLGGFPTRDQNPEYPACIQCGKTMSFLLQLPYNLPLSNGDDNMWGDSNTDYYFWCDDCAISTMVGESR